MTSTTETPLLTPSHIVTRSQTGTTVRAGLVLVEKTGKERHSGPTWGDLTSRWHRLAI